MKILFYIQTCQKYYSTRLKTIQETYLKRIKYPNEILFLSDEDEIRLHKQNGSFDLNESKWVIILSINKYVSSSAYM